VVTTVLEETAFFILKIEANRIGILMGCVTEMMVGIYERVGEEGTNLRGQVLVLRRTVRTLAPVVGVSIPLKECKVSFRDRLMRT
jgi:hypothetical protein